MINLKTKNWSVENIDTVLFDKDGTIQDLNIYWGEIIKMRSDALIDRLKLKPSFFEKICLWMGYDLEKKRLLEKGPVGILSREEIIDQLIIDFKKNNIDIKREVILKIFDEVHRNFLIKMDDYVKILPGIRDFIIDLKEKSIKIAIVTSDTVDNAKKCINLLGIDKYVDQYIGRDHSLLPKASGEQAKIALNLLNSKAENTVCFGDAPMDLLMAEKSELKAGIGIAFGQTPVEELLKYSKYVINSYNQLRIY